MLHIMHTCASIYVLCEFYLSTLFLSNIHTYVHIATEMWCLGRFLPLIVGDLVADDSAHWSHFLQLLTIMEYIFAPVTSSDNMNYVEILIEDFLLTWQELYPLRTLTPKMHYLLHFPAWMAR